MARFAKNCAIIGCILVVAGWALWRYFTASYDGDTAVWVYVPKESDARQLTDSLKASLGDSFGGKVAMLWTAMQGDACASHGAYRVNPGDKAMTIAKRLRRRIQTPVRVTFNNVRTMDQMAERVTAYLEMGPNDFLAAADSLTYNCGFNVSEMPASFLPDTYEFYWTASPQTVVSRLIDYRNKFWTDDRLAKAEALGLTPVQVATIASIAEEETNSADERPVVARLYLNRLHRGMLLQADPTVKWAVGDFSLRRITGKHIAVESPYNTYKHIGLPPGPIRIPSAATLDGVLNAPTHNYIYMCASDDFSGRHKFTASYAEHQQNARRYRAALNRRNIR